jgi:TRAP transporter 4TM/12TM fusion protein
MNSSTGFREPDNGLKATAGKVAVPDAVEVEQSCLEYVVTTKKLDNTTVIAALIAVLGLSFAFFHLYTSYFTQPTSYLMNTMHVTFMVCMGVLLFPRGRKSWNEKLNAWFAWDLLCFFAIMAVQVYILWDFEAFVARRGTDNPTDILVGLILIFLVMEACHRVLGLTLCLLVLFFLSQTIYGEFFFGIFYGPNIDISFIIGELFMDSNGIYSIPIAVSATYVVMFIMFGAFVMRVGVGKIFQDIAYSLMWRQLGGPAKAAVLSSAFMASISGSAVSNVVTTGTMTIPLMKRMGYPPLFAAAVEASASTGGVFTPPVMGAVAFVIAEFMGVSYWDVVKAAAIPAIIYFIAIFAMVHFRAAKLDLRIKEAPVLPGLRQILKERGYLLLPLFLLVVVMVLGFSAIFAAIVGILSMFILSWFRPDTRMSALDFFSTFEDTARMMVNVAIPSAMAGLIIGAVFYSGLAVRFSSTIIDLAQGNMVLGLLLAMVISLLLGMGLTVMAVYILMAALVIPSLIAMGVDPVAAHFFAFHFGVHSYITPPVALSAYAASAIAKTPPMRTGFETFRLAFAAYLIPFMFVFAPELLWQGPWYLILVSSVWATIGVIALAAAVEGWLVTRLGILERVLMGAASLLLLHTSYITSAAGAVLALAVFFWNHRQSKTTPAVQAIVS